MNEELTLLRELHAVCQELPAILIPNRLREVIIRCALHYGQDPPHCEDDPTPESLLVASAEHINLLLENVGHWDKDGFESPEEWRDAEQIAQAILMGIPQLKATDVK